jgi:hypothetical protein
MAEVGRSQGSGWAACAAAGCRSSMAAVACVVEKPRLLACLLVLFMSWACCAHAVACWFGAAALCVGLLTRQHTCSRIQP